MTKLTQPEIAQIENKLAKQLDKKLAMLDDLVKLVPEIKVIVEERKEQEIFNRKAAKIGRWLILAAGAVGTFTATVYAVAKMIVDLGSK